MRNWKELTIKISGSNEHFRTKPLIVDGESGHASEDCSSRVINTSMASNQQSFITSSPSIPKFSLQPPITVASVFWVLIFQGTEEWSSYFRNDALSSTLPTVKGYRGEIAIIFICTLLTICPFAYHNDKQKMSFSKCLWILTSIFFWRKKIRPGI